MHSNILFFTQKHPIFDMWLKKINATTIALLFAAFAHSQQQNDKVKSDIDQWFRTVNQSIYMECEERPNFIFNEDMVRKR